MDLVAVGSPEFTLGFELVGLKTFNYSKAGELRSIPKEKVGVVIVDESIVSAFGEDDLKFFEDSINPLFVMLSTSGRREDMARLIRRSIGIEL